MVGSIQNLGATEREIRFSIPSGEATQSLMLAADQAEVGIMFVPQTTTGVTTHAVEGEYTLADALDLLLQDSALVAVRDSSGAYAVIEPALKGGNDPKRYDNFSLNQNTPPPLNQEISMNEKKRTFGSLLKGLLALAVASSANLAAQDVTDEVYELSPFSVDSSDDSGYSATSTLSGTRIRTDLKDLGAAISVVTTELMEDLGATDAGSLLSYTSNMEVGGNQGNFSGAGVSATSRIDLSESRANPQGNQRVRGLFRADLTRGLFLTDIPFDSYNTSRVTISRGPNSLLFGIGSPGGVIDNSLKEAILSERFGEVKFRFDNYGSSRTELDLNRSLVDGRIALRIGALRDDTEYKQKPAWNRDERLFANIQAVLFENEKSNFLDATRLKINGETGTSRGSPVEVIPPSVAYTGWFEPTSANLKQFTGEVVPSNLVSPNEGGSWVFQETYNPFILNAEGQLRTNVHPSIFQGPGIIFRDANSSIADVGTGDGLQVNYGAIPWGSKDTLASTGLAGTPGAIAAFGAGASGSTVVKRVTEYHANSPFGEPFAVGFTVPSLQNTDVFDYRNKVYSGGIDRIDRKFSAKSIAFEQTFLNNKFGFDIAYDDQHYESDEDFYFSGGRGGSTGGPYDIYVTISEYLVDGQLNPNFGRAYTRVSAPETFFAESDRETFRVTTFGEIDFTEKEGWAKYFGKHKVTGLFSDYELNTHGMNFIDTMNSTEFDPRSAGRNRRLNESGRWVNTLVYTSDSLIGVPSMNDVRLQQINISRPQPGDAFDGIYVELLNVGKYSASNPAPRKVERGEYFIEQILNEETIGRSEIESQAVSWQSYFLDDHVIGLVGYREDDTNSFGRANEAEVGFNDTDVDGRWDPDFTRLSATPGLSQKADSLTWSVVARFPEKVVGELPWGMDLQAHYAESENFNPIGLRSNAFGESIGQPTGTTKEYGVTTSFADNRVSIKLNWFQTSLQNLGSGGAFEIANDSLASISLYRQAELAGKPWEENLALVNGAPGSFPIQDYNTYYQLAQNDIPAGLLAIYNPRQEDTDGDGVWDTLDWDSVPNLSATRDLKAEGFEVELVASLSKGWRVMANLSQQESVNANTASVMLEAAREFLENTKSSRTFEVVQQRLVADRTVGDTWFRDRFVPLVAQASLDGTKSQEQREWRFAGITNYEFLEGRLKGVELGGAVRWEDEAATGYVTTFDPNAEVAIPIADTSRPFLDDGLFSGDLWIAYSRKIRNDSMAWRIQLNIRNAFGDNSDIPVRTNPDGQIAVIRIPNPRTLSITNSIKF
jgi:outer membrane receptor protein involved in Fe transport